MTPTPNPPNPRVPYWRVWRDAEGISHQHQAWLENFELTHLAEGMVDIWRTPTQTETTGILFLHVVPGVTYDWHENPRPQWIVALSGRWFLETMDGHRVEMGPGELSFGGDQDCRCLDGKQGHRSGAVGNEPAVLMLVQVEQAPADPLVPA